jgi:hypothetical protein
MFIGNPRNDGKEEKLLEFPELVGVEAEEAKRRILEAHPKLNVQVSEPAMTGYGGRSRREHPRCRMRMQLHAHAHTHAHAHMHTRTCTRAHSTY